MGLMDWVVISQVKKGVGQMEAEKGVNLYMIDLIRR